MGQSVGDEKSRHHQLARFSRSRPQLFCSGLGAIVSAPAAVSVGFTVQGRACGRVRRTPSIDLLEEVSLERAAAFADKGKLA
jgi:hypothetical protein